MVEFLAGMIVGMGVLAVVAVFLGNRKRGDVSPPLPPEVNGDVGSRRKSRTMWD